MATTVVSTLQRDSIVPWERLNSMVQPLNRTRRGATLVEMLVSTLLLATALTASVPALRWIGLERRAAQQHLLALTELENVVESLNSRSWDELTGEVVQSVALSPEVQSQLPGAQLRSQLTETADAKQISLELQWNGVHGRPLAPVRVSAWKYRLGAAP